MLRVRVTSLGATHHNVPRTRKQRHTIDIGASRVDANANTVLYVRLPFENQPGVYSVWVTPPTGPAIKVADNYAFRTEQQHVSNLTNWVTEAEVGRISAHLYHQEFE